MRLPILLITTSLLLSCAKQGNNGLKAPQPSTEPLAAYSMLAPSKTGQTLIYGRIILPQIVTDNDSCPMLQSDDGELIRTTMRGFRPNETLFPVTVCEAIIAPNKHYIVKGSTLGLAKTTLAPKHIQVFGDTGCKEKVCNDAPAEPFKTLADLASKNSKDLILHMGDFNYRGTSGSISGNTYAYDAGDGGYGGATCGLETTYYSQNAINSPRPDSWENWKVDFFEPAKKLMATAPWVFARGNHELCSRAGVGWFYFFGPGAQFDDSITQQVCPNQGDYTNPPKTAASHIAMIKPYGLELDGLNLWVFDSANACDELATNDLTAQYTAQFEQLNTFATNSNNATWMMTHRPIWGLNSVTPLDTLNKQLQTALARTKSGVLPSQVALSLSGHMHIYQSLTFFPDSARPPQIVVGNSGVSLSNNSDNESVSVNIDSQQAIVNTQGKFGYLSLEQTAKTKLWHGGFFDTQGTVFITCNLDNTNEQRSVCNKVDE
ncbi:metallophosphoesterase [Pseudoalteromonas byunsanensis]|uniref:Metallophosphoesterase n=1 Tax=Pseudoalteromonas byunsanensis TaxID=327939 RepID=A0A1S1NAL1_9GAMM|nr:metallophosphoesterase [Pseudoalteromonas byunsanensis]OHU96484.1 metallophosphoesterase [Pseudoalteromonas byunsanensis]